MSAHVKVVTHQRSASLDQIASYVPSLKDRPSQVASTGVVHQRPRHTRHRSSKSEDYPIGSIRSAFKRLLPKTWGLQSSFTSLALDFYMVAIGLTAGITVERLSLDYLEVVMLAVELSRVVDTSNVLFVVSEATDQLFAIHTQTLGARLDDHPDNDPTIFARQSEGRVVPCEATEATHLTGPFNFLRVFLRQSTRQCMQTSEFGWSPLESAHNMGSLSSWLLEHPVVGIAAPAGDRSELRDPLRWQLQVRLEGHEPRYDHTFIMGSVPTSLFPEKKVFVSNNSQDCIKMSALLDRVQTTMFHRLSASEAASAWSDITTEWIPSDDAALLDA